MSQRSIFSGRTAPSVRIDTPPQLEGSRNGTDANPTARKGSNTVEHGPLVTEMNTRVGRGGSVPRLVKSYSDGTSVYVISGDQANDMMPELENAVLGFLVKNPFAWYPHQFNRKDMHKMALYFSRDRRNQISSIAMLQFVERETAPGAGTLFAYFHYLEGFSPGANHVVETIGSELAEIDPAGVDIFPLRPTQFGEGPMTKAGRTLIGTKLSAASRGEWIMNTPQFDALQLQFDEARVEQMRLNALKHARRHERALRGSYDPIPTDRQRTYLFFKDRLDWVRSQLEPQ